MLAASSTTDTLNNRPFLEVIWILTEVAKLRYYFAYASRCSLGVWILLLAAFTTSTLNNRLLPEVIWIPTEAATLR